MRWLAALGLITLALSATPAFTSDDSATVQAASTETATFSMYCYWTGEATLGRVDGVVASRIGHWGGAEIVQVDYDPARTNIGELSQALKHQRSFYALIAGDEAERERAAGHLDGKDIDSRRGSPHFIDPKHSLRTRHPELTALDLTEQQAIALNTWSYFGGPMPDVLTAEQKARLERR
ncbi:MAG: hypothetical protein AAF560_07495 [Acidobacteriota bacterium]